MVNNNGIRNSLVAGLPTPPSGSVDKSDSANVHSQSGNALPPPATNDRKDAPKEPERAEIQEAAAEFRRRAAQMGRDLHFEIDDDSGVTVIKVIDPATEEVVRQIPSEEAVARAGQREDRPFNLIDETA
jgi:flagellar protein FlaG